MNAIEFLIQENQQARAYANFKFIGFNAELEPYLEQNPLIQLDKGC